jgi:hypothetical protein
MPKHTIVIYFVLFIRVIIVTSIFSLSHKSSAQVDPEWLRSWHEAVDLQPKNISSSSTIVSKTEPGIPLIINGQVFKPDGQLPAHNALIHMYHRDHEGLDFGLNDNSLTTWRLQGWAKANTEGKFEFHTIRPAPDHMGREGSHIHFTIVTADFGKQWAPKIYLLADDSITDNERKAAETAGQFGWLKVAKTIDAVQYIDVQITLKEKADF